MYSVKGVGGVGGQRIGLPFQTAVYFNLPACCPCTVGRRAQSWFGTEGARLQKLQLFKRRALCLRF